MAKGLFSDETPTVSTKASPSLGTTVSSLKDKILSQLKLSTVIPLLLIGVVVYQQYQIKNQPIFGPVPVAPVATAVSAPALILANAKSQAATQQAKDDVNKDLSDLVGLYAALEDVLSRDKSIIKSTESFYSAHSNSGVLLFGGNLKGKYSNLAASLNGEFERAVTLANRSLDEPVTVGSGKTVRMALAETAGKLKTDFQTVLNNK